MIVYVAAVNGSSLNVAADTDIVVEGEALSYDSLTIAKGRFHILYRHRGYRVEVMDADLTQKRVTLRVNGRLYTVSLKDQLDLIVEKMGIGGASKKAHEAINAPMPGLIASIKVAAGDVVATGDALLVLEAMKMENTLTAPHGGTIKEIKVKKGENVEKGQALVLLKAQ